MRRVIGYLPQILSVDGTLTGKEDLAVAASLYDVPRSEREGVSRAPFTSWRSKTWPIGR